MAINRNKYKEIFEKRFGKGSYDAGLKQASDIGTSKVKAEIAKDQYMQALKEAQAAAKKAQKEAEKRAEEEAMYGGQSKKSWEAKNKAQGEITKQQEKAQAQGRGGHLPTRENQMKERKAIEEGRKKTLDPSEMTPYARGEYDKPKESKKSGLGVLKDFLTSKDVDKDGDRDGLLGLMDRFVAPVSKGATEMFIPGNSERMAKNSPKNAVVKATQKDRGLETKVLNTIGAIGATAVPYAKGYKAAETAVNKKSQNLQT
ncbi:hypothetical protein D0469_07025 [Peribacillus saganii]|uniref:Uncharacterized protein n=1 Tax=Peribacillus saganii TaxID=2303992 RepID=A0A372LQL7_9BACI|nr:hypothetical protein [Peribacillus saganii]RFU70346.1 hypothetical protein D0469_07025 [Peribacillus saganii]